MKISVVRHWKHSTIATVDVLELIWGWKAFRRDLLLLVFSLQIVFNICNDNIFNFIMFIKFEPKSRFFFDLKNFSTLSVVWKNGVLKNSNQFLYIFRHQNSVHTSTFDTKMLLNHAVLLDYRKLEYLLVHLEWNSTFRNLHVQDLHWKQSYGP